MNEGHDLVRPYIMTGVVPAPRGVTFVLQTLLQTRSEHIRPTCPTSSSSCSTGASVRCRSRSPPTSTWWSGSS